MTLPKYASPIGNMNRRHLLAAGVAGMSGGISLPGIGQVKDFGDIINKAGRQRMLTQRLVKVWLATLHNIEPLSTPKIFDSSFALFERQLIELKASAPNAEIRETYQQLETVWGGYKRLLLTKAQRELIPELLKIDAQLLALAHQGTEQLEASATKPTAKLVNLAGRQRMLTQRMAKFYLLAALPYNFAQAVQEVNAARTEFVTASSLLRAAPEATDKIKQELDLAANQWAFLDVALQNIQSRDSANRMKSLVFLTSENILAVMDRVTDLYVAVKA